MEKQTNGVESKYAKKFALRRRADNNAEHPMPRPFHLDYFPKHTVKWYGSQDYRPLPCENLKMSLKFRRPIH